MTLRFLTAGESHGKSLNAIIEGVPAGFELDINFINQELANRQKGYGRGGRMQIETDKVEILSGVRFGKTIGSPIALQIKNKDWENWQIPMSTQAVDEVENAEILAQKKITIPRPGHTDYAGSIKYSTDDIRDILERSSARETATRVAVGAICQNILKAFDISGEFNILSIGGEVDSEKFNAKIDSAKEKGTTLGGIIQIVFKNVPIGLGSHVHWDRKLDGKIAQAMMSIPAIKSVEIGLGKECANLEGHLVHDEFVLNDGCVVRKTNNAGGIEGGITNGENIVVTVAMKPIPTMKTPLKSFDIKDMQEREAHFERSDTSAVEACATVALNMLAFVILEAFLERYGSDSYTQIRENYGR